MRGFRWLFALVGLVGLYLLVFRGEDGGQIHEGTITLTRQAAIQGLNETARKLVADSTSWSNHPEKYAFLNASLGDVRYSTEVAAPYGESVSKNGCAVDTVDVVSTAALENGESHRVEATYVRTCGDDMGIRLVNFAER